MDKEPGLPESSSTSEVGSGSVSVAHDLASLLSDPQNPVVARLVKEVTEGRQVLSGYDRAHNRHNRS